MKSDLQVTSPITISNKEARQFLLDHHFLLPPKNLTIKQIIPRLFSRLGCIQFDTINVVGRNPDLVLQSRVKDYQEGILDQLLYQDRQLIDGWDKVASIYSVEDWPFFERQRKRMGNYNHRRSRDASIATSNILTKIKENGRASSLDFKDSPKTDWAWGPTSVTRAALEILYTEGSLGISHRVNTRRYFDLIERLIPAEILHQPDPNITDEDYQEWHILRRIGGLGIASLRSGEHWLGIDGARKVPERKKIITRLLQKDKVVLVKIDNLENQDFFIRKEELSRLRKISQPSKNNKAAFLAPLDNLLWNRKLIKDIFDFDYTWEVYKPKHKREYGYYVLPVLLGDKFIARVDLKYERKEKTLKLNNWWWETGVQISPDSRSAIRSCMRNFINYLEADSFKLSKEALKSPRIKELFEGLG